MGMTTRNMRWGSLLLLFSVLLVLLVAIVAAGRPADATGSLVRVTLPSFACLLGITALFAGHVSYPRVQNLRVYLAGYLVGVQSIVLGVFRGFDALFADAIAAAPPGYAQLVFLLATVGAYLFTLLPAFPTYRVTQATTWIVVVLQLALLVLARLVPSWFGFLRHLVPGELISVPVLVGATLTVGVIVINALLTAHGYYLRGAISGLALLAGASWVLPVVMGELGYPVAPGLVNLLYAAAAPLFLSVTVVFHVLAKLDHRVSYDPLLQVFNREFANAIIAEQSNVQTKPPFGLMMIDIDHFKQVNDTHGHQAGDRVLFSVAQRIQKEVVPDGVVCRYGGEELIVFFPGLTGRDIVPLARRLRERIEESETLWKRHRIGVSVSIGISDRRFARQPLSHVVHAADKALYIAKDNGRNQVRFVRLKDPRRVSR